MTYQIIIVTIIDKGLVHVTRNRAHTCIIRTHYACRPKHLVSLYPFQSVVSAQSVCYTITSSTVDTTDSQLPFSFVGVIYEFRFVVVIRAVQAPDAKRLARPFVGFHRLNTYSLAAISRSNYKQMLSAAF